ncbi:MAG: hypothetical protein M3416_03135 [Acidobacteriota bacterium]|nr:hypothetical protein [Acidobacteriota bacterium]
MTEVGQALGVDALLDGTVQMAGGRVRAVVQLINVSDYQPLWAAKFDEPFSDVFTLQDSISERVLHTLADKITAAG